MLHIDGKPIDLKLTTPFRISRAVQAISPNVVVQIHSDGQHKGYGEAAQMSIMVKVWKRCWPASRCLRGILAMIHF
jgi:L-alanine-DL-glutamate epimerase-like enolase superfamily enzyme